MRRFLGVSLFLVFLTSPSAFADAVSCQTEFAEMTTANQYPDYCPFDYATTGRPSVVRLEDFDCAAEGGSVPDEVCWQRALNCAFNPAPGSFQFGSVEATEGVSYEIDDTLCLIGAQAGVIHGNGARLYWTGTNAALSPMFYFGGAQQMRIDNMQIISFPETPMHTAMLFGSTEASAIVSHQNHLEDIFVIGVNTGSLAYGIRFAGPSSFTGNPLDLADESNDLFTIDTCNIAGVDKAGISIEHSQSLQHHLMNTELYGSAGNATIDSDDCMHSDLDPKTQACDSEDMIQGASGVRVIYGSFDWYGGFIGSFGNAAYFIDTANTIGIRQLNSENCARLLRTQDGPVGFPGIVGIYGGRFAAELINSDRRLIEWYRLGPLRIEGLHIDELTESGPVKFYINPQIVSGAPNAMAEVDISHVNFYIPGSSGWSDIFDLANPTRTHLVSVGNECMDSTPAAAGCPGYGAGADQAVAALKNKNLSDASNVFPSTLATTSTSQTLTNKDLSSGNTFPSTLATTTSSQSLTNKTLTDSTNVFPATATIGFTKPLGTSSLYCAPNTAICSLTESPISLAVPAMRARTLSCKSSAAPGASNKNWSISLRVGASTIGSACSIVNTATSCSIAIDNASRWSDGAEMALYFVASSPTPASATVLCSLGLNP